MLDQVEVTVAEQPLPRLQAVGFTDTVFPFLYELGWGPRESFSPARLRRHGPRDPQSGCFPAPVMNSSGSGRHGRAGPARSPVPVAARGQADSFWSRHSRKGQAAATARFPNPRVNKAPATPTAWLTSPVGGDCQTRTKPRTNDLRSRQT
jgi:hypothetical protein